MIRTRSLLLASLALFAASSVRADDQADAKAIIEKAIKAVGGADKLDKTKSFTSKLDGTVSVMGMEIKLKSTTSFQYPDRMRTESDVDVMGMQIKTIQIFNKDKGWLIINDMTIDMTEDMIKSIQDRFYLGKVNRLTPLLTDKEFKLSTLGESNVDGHDAIGVRIESKDHSDISLYFDKKTYLIAKIETREKDPQGGAEYNSESFVSDYKETDGLKTAQKVKVLHDGKEFLTGAVSEFKLQTDLSDTLFVKP